MDRIPVMELLAHSAFIIERNTGQMADTPLGQWIALQQMAQPKAYQLLTSAAKNYRPDLLVMIFEDEQSIQDFLADTDPLLAPLQRYARIARSTYGVFVMTAAEVLRNLSMGWGACTVGSGNWVEQLVGSTMNNEDVPFQEFNSSDLEILFNWDWWEIQKGGPSGYLFRVLTENIDQMMRAAWRLPNDLPFIEAMVDSETLKTYFEDRTELPLLVIPTDRRQPAMWFERHYDYVFDGAAKVYVAEFGRNGPVICSNNFAMLPADVPLDVRLAAE